MKKENNGSRPLREELNSSAVYEIGLPVVYIANDYSKEEEPQLNVAAFDEWDYNEISSRNDSCL